MTENKMTCIACNGFVLKDKKFKGKTGVYQYTSGVSDSTALVCPACRGTGEVNGQKLSALIAAGFLPNENPAVLSSKSIKEARYCTN
jgi:RecJ-like exonuclease